MPEKNEELDAVILGAVSKEWQKTAILISKAFDAPALKNVESPAKVIVSRIQILADSGKLEVNGNLRRWRDSSVRLVG